MAASALVNWTDPHASMMSVVGPVVDLGLEGHDARFPSRSPPIFAARSLTSAIRTSMTAGQPLSSLRLLPFPKRLLRMRMRPLRLLRRYLRLRRGIVSSACLQLVIAQGEGTTCQFGQIS